MAKIKLTKSAVDAAQAQAQPVELRDTLVPGLMCKARGNLAEYAEKPCAIAS